MRSIFVNVRINLSKENILRISVSLIYSPSISIFDVSSDEEDNSNQTDASIIENLNAN